MLFLRTRCVRYIELMHLTLTLNLIPGAYTGCGRYRVRPRRRTILHLPQVVSVKDINDFTNAICRHTRSGDFAVPHGVSGAPLEPPSARCSAAWPAVDTLVCNKGTPLGNILLCHNRCTTKTRTPQMRRWRLPWLHSRRSECVAQRHECPSSRRTHYRDYPRCSCGCPFPKQ